MRRRPNPHHEVVNLALINLAMEAKRVSTRPAHAARVERHELAHSLNELQASIDRDKKRRSAMVRVTVALLVLLGCFAVAIGNQWLRFPQAAAIVIGMVAYTAFVAEVVSD